MLIRNFGLFIVALCLFFCNDSFSSPPAKQIPQVFFVKEIYAGKPVAITVDPEGRIYAVQKDSTIQVISPGGLIIKTIEGVDDKGVGLLDEPSGIAFYDQKLYLIDRSASEVCVFSMTGKFLERFGSSGRGFKAFKDPSGIDVYEGLIYVADSGNDRIQIFGPNGVYLRSIDGLSLETIPGNPFDDPTGLAVDHRGFVYVSCKGQTNVFSGNGAFWKSLPNTEDPMAVAVAADGVYVADQEALSIKKYDFDGNFLFSFGSRGADRTQFGRITGICVDDAGKVYVADPEQELIHVIFPEQGKAYDSWNKVPAQTSVQWVKDIPVRAGKALWAGHERIFAVDFRNEVILSIRDNQVDEKIAIKDCAPISIALDPEDSLWVLDGHEKRVLRLDEHFKISYSFGSSGRKPGQLKKPADMAINSRGIIYVADPGNHWVQTFSHDGISLEVFREGRNNIPFLEPVALALDENDRLYVLDGKRSTVTAFSPEGNCLFEFGEKGKNKGQLQEPVSLFATTHEIFVLDRGSSSIKVFTSNGVFLREFGAKGHGNGDFNNPVFMAGISDTLFMVSDAGNRRIQVLETLYSPTPPADLAALGITHAIELSWKESPEPSVSAYRVYRAENPDGPYKAVVTTKSLKYTDSDVTSKKTCYYRVSAITRDGLESGTGDIVSAVPTKLPAPMPLDLAATARECFVELSWRPLSNNAIMGYVVFREEDGQSSLIGNTREARFKDTSSKPGKTYTYKVSSISADGRRGEPAAILTRTPVFSGPELGLEILEFRPVFAAHKDQSASIGIGRIRISNNTCTPMSGIKISFLIREFMDVPQEQVIEQLSPAAAQEIVFKPVFNSALFKVIGKAQMTGEVKITYYHSGKLNTVHQNTLVDVYDLHYLALAQQEGLAAFMTFEDPPVSAFVRSVLKQQAHGADNLQTAAVIFHALRLEGISCQHPLAEAVTDPVVRVQYPRETLDKKTGNERDLMVLYAAALECAGVSTAWVRNQGQWLILLYSGIMDDRASELKSSRMISIDGRLWVPVDVALLEKTFMNAWESGYDKYLKKENKSWVFTRDAWMDFLPVGLPVSDKTFPKIHLKDSVSVIAEEKAQLQKTVVRLKGKRHLKMLSDYPDNVDALLQMGIIHARVVAVETSKKMFKKILDIGPHAGALNNLGNLHFMSGHYPDARTRYQKAVDLEPQDSFIWVNLARCLKRMDQKKGARECLYKAIALNGEVRKRFPSLCHEFLGQEQKDVQAETGFSAGQTQFLDALHRKLERMTPDAKPAESSEIRPFEGLYWKGEEIRKPVPADEMALFQEALGLAEKGKAPASELLLKQFLDGYPNSILKDDAVNALEQLQH